MEQASGLTSCLGFGTLRGIHLDLGKAALARAGMHALGLRLPIALKADMPLAGLIPLWGSGCPCSSFTFNSCFEVRRRLLRDACGLPK